MGRRLASSLWKPEVVRAILPGRRAILPGRRAILPGRDFPAGPLDSAAVSGAWRSLVARLLWEQEVLGSNPGAPTRWPVARGRWRVADGAWPISALSTFVQIFDTNVDRVTESGREWRRAPTASAAGVEARSDRRRCWRAVSCSIAHKVARNLDSDLLHQLGCSHLRVAEGAPVEGGLEVCENTRFRARRWPVVVFGCRVTWGAAVPSGRGRLSGHSSTQVVSRAGRSPCAWPAGVPSKGVGCDWVFTFAPMASAGRAPTGRHRGRGRSAAWRGAGRIGDCRSVARPREGSGHAGSQSGSVRPERRCRPG